MREIIIAYPNEKTAVTLRQTLTDNDLPYAHICSNGSTVLQIADTIGDGVIICPSILSDMPAHNLAEMLPANFDIIALSSSSDNAFSSNITVLNLPLNKNNFIETVTQLCCTAVYISPKRKTKSAEDTAVITKAKSILMAKNSISESVAHKTLQRISMSRGKKLIETALEIIKENE